MANDNIITIAVQEDVSVVEIKEDNTLTVGTQEDVIVVKFSDGVLFVDKYVGVDLSSEELTVTDDGAGTVYVN